MGRLVMIRCDCGYEYQGYRCGVNCAYPEVKKHQTALVKSGHYGKQWKELLNNDPELNVNAEYRLYQCPNCHNIYDEFCLDLYKSEHDDHHYYTPTEEETLYHYKHICPECKKRMDMIPLYEVDYWGADKREEPAYCPKCGDVAIVRFCGHFD